MQRQQQGFTLIELMVVAVIMAILAASAYPIYQHFVRKTREENVRADLINNAHLLESYYMKNKTFSTFTNDKLTQGKSSDFFTISGAYQNSSYRLTATPTPQNSLETQNVVYDSINGTLLCAQDGNCNPM